MKTQFKMNKLQFVVAFTCFVILSCTENKKSLISSDSVKIIIQNVPEALWEYQIGSLKQVIAPPMFQLDGKDVIGIFSSFTTEQRLIGKINVMEYTITGPLSEIPEVTLTLVLRLSPDNPIVRFRYSLASEIDIKMTKRDKKDQITYAGTSANKYDHFTEVNLSVFFQLHQGYLPVERTHTLRSFENESTFMGPILVLSNQNHALLLSYEHGSQLPDRFIEFGCHENKDITISAVKGNYFEGQSLKNGYKTLWMNIGAVKGDVSKMAQIHRHHILNYMSENTASRKPYIFYNTWNYQERNKAWYDKPFLFEMNKNRMLKEIDVAHKMGVDVFVIDAGWFEISGDWVVSKDRFPDGLKEVKAKLDSYGMFMGLWFNPEAAVTSNMLMRNKKNVMIYNGKSQGPREVWETEESYAMCLVSPFMEDFANEFIRVGIEYDIKYFKWDGFGQYGCNATGHWHGTKDNTPEEREDCYSYQLPFAMVEIANKICEAIPDAIVDFDITEGERAVGLAFLEAGKYYAVNNGPYFYSLNYPQYAPGVGMGPNVLVFPGLARAINARRTLAFDKWIPSSLFLTHYLPDEPEYSQWINIGSLILGQNGIWGDLLNISEAGVDRFGEVLSIFKGVRDDITKSKPVRSGIIGSSPEIHEKINSENGKGVVVIFYNYNNVWGEDPANSFHGEFTYITENKVNKLFWANSGTDVTFDGHGRAIITSKFTGAGAKIIFFGVE